jgi:hypothetical protein
MQWFDQWRGWYTAARQWFYQWRKWHTAARQWFDQWRGWHATAKQWHAAASGVCTVEGQPSIWEARVCKGRETRKFKEARKVRRQER